MFTIRIPILCLIGFFSVPRLDILFVLEPSLTPAALIGDYQAHLARMAMIVAMFFAYVLFGVFAFLRIEKGRGAS